jgi:8-oxo-dGTP pyrophosphatase MutT (NUDIX family)
MTRSSAYVPLTPDGRVLLQHRDGGAPRYPNCWALFGGARKDGETAEQCLVREVREELGRDPEPFELVGEVTCELTGRKVDVFAAALVNQDLEALRAGQTEGDTLDLFPVADVLARKLVMPEHCREAVQLVGNWCKVAGRLSLDRVLYGFSAHEVKGVEVERVEPTALLYKRVGQQ